MPRGPKISGNDLLRQISGEIKSFGAHFSVWVFHGAPRADHNWKTRNTLPCQLWEVANAAKETFFWISSKNHRRIIHRQRIRNANIYLRSLNTNLFYFEKLSVPKKLIRCFSTGNIGKYVFNLNFIRLYWRLFAVWLKTNIIISCSGRIKKIQLRHLKYLLKILVFFLCKLPACPYYCSLASFHK